MANLSFHQVVLLLSGCKLDDHPQVREALTECGYDITAKSDNSIGMHIGEVAKALKNKYPRLLTALPSGRGIEPEVFTAYAEQWVAANQSRFPQNIPVEISHGRGK